MAGSMGISRHASRIYCLEQICRRKTARHHYQTSDCRCLDRCFRHALSRTVDAQLLRLSPTVSLPADIGTVSPGRVVRRSAGGPCASHTPPIHLHLPKPLWARSGCVGGLLVERHEFQGRRLFSPRAFSIGIAPWRVLSGGRNQSFAMRVPNA